MVKLTMEPVTRIEGHAKITVDLDDAGNVQDTKLHVMEFRGFEKFLQGRNIEEVPRIVPRICGICDVQHHLAAAKAVDEIFGFSSEEILPTAYRMREIMNWGSTMHSHALHFYFLAAPDFIAGKDRKTRNVFQIIKDAPDVALQAIELRKNALSIIKAIGGRPIHPTSSTPGGISTSLDDETQKDLLKKAQRNVELAVATLDLAKPIFEENLDLVKTLGYIESYHCGLVKDGVWDMYDGKVRMKDKEGKLYAEFKNTEYLDYMAEHVKP
ncbi:MAG TPA: Ni/Fe hydrogenase subunit alpha, partial [Methanobacteriaceae archaeon]|nr:Ni/Fe hydrogenase subunit alpha [Methanobacteriaceae archaeon]